MRRRAAATALAVAALASAVHPRSAGAIDVSNSPEDSLTPVVARDGATVNVAWIESQPTQDGLRATIYAARSTDGGHTFEPPVAVAPLAGYATGLQIRACAGRVHLAWLVTSYTIGAPAAVDYARSTDGGETFETARVVNAGAFPASPELAAMGDRVAVVWASGGNVWAVASADGGAMFSEPWGLDGDGGAVDGSSRAALADADLGVVWIEGIGADRAVWFRAVDIASPAGSTPPLRLSTPGDGAAEPDLEAAAATFAAVWSDGAGAVFGAWSSDGGASFIPLPRVAKASAVAMPRIAMSGPVVHRVWLDRAGRLVYRRDAAASTAPLVLRTLGRRAVFPDIAVSGDVVCVAWQTKSGRAARLLAAVSSDAGARFRPASGLSRRDEFAAAPRAVIADGRGAVTWQMPVAGRQDVFFESLAP